jgi:hypothetical protein
MHPPPVPGVVYGHFLYGVQGNRDPRIFLSKSVHWRFVDQGLEREPASVSKGLGHHGKHLII